MYTVCLVQVLSDVRAARYIHGVAVHWYLDGLVPAEISLGITHHLYPDYYLFGTEACAGWSPLERGVKLGSWDRAEEYAHDIMEVRGREVVLTRRFSPLSQYFVFVSLK